MPTSWSEPPTDNCADNAVCVLVLDDELPRWLAANTAAVLGIALGAHGLIKAGPDLADAAGSLHPGIGTTPVPVLGSPRSALPLVRQKAMAAGVTVIDFNEAARKSKSYEEYEKHFLADPLDYLGIALHGPRKAVKSVSRSLKSLT
ncbi:DUF2000 domain-containing protein [Streptomyces sp. NPDC050161]|uniref:DUF2000 domain-containing protein n=1 Tax=Streptomyces sp. NPDC050161 TaxID=3365604 RepID=UPI0037B93CE3